MERLGIILCVVCVAAVAAAPAQAEVGFLAINAAVCSEFVQVVDAQNVLGVLDETTDAAKAAALANLTNAPLSYDAEDVNVLFQVYDGAGNLQTSDGKTWMRVAGGLGDAVGAVLNLGEGELGVNLGGPDGSGVQTVPEPGSLALLIGTALCLLPFLWRRRR